MNYFDIHTHQNNSNTKVRSIKNLIAGIDTPPDNLWFSAGIHPWYLKADFLPKLESLIKQPQCLAVGECGLDMMPEIINKYPLQIQGKIFLAQAELAEQYQKPLIIHCVKCYDKLLAIKKSFKPETPWIVHGFTKSANLAHQLTKAGFYLSFGAQLFKSDKNSIALDATSLDRIFLETDEQTDYDIKQIYQKAATIKNMSLSSLQQQIEKNFKEVFGKIKL